MPNPNIRTALVIGATGKTGRRLTPRLIARGVTVRAASRSGAAGTVAFDWSRPETFAPALMGVDAVYLVAPDFVEDPTPAAAPLLDAAKAAGVRAVALLSSLGAAFPGEPETSGRLKLERLVQGSGLDWTILRPGGFSQNFSEGFLLPGILRAGQILSAAGEGRVPFVDADDIAEVAAIALTQTGHAGRTYALTGPEALSFDDAARMIGQAAGRPIGHTALTQDAFGAILRQAGAPEDYLAMILRDQEAIRTGAAAGVSDAIANVTGKPPITFETFVAKSAAAWRQAA